MKQVETQDKTLTLYNATYGEQYHSSGGAVAEAVKKYVEPCRIAELAREGGSVRVLDVCFGLGYNAIAAIDAVLQVEGATIEVVSLELDRDVLGELEKLDPPLHHYHLAKRVAEGCLQNKAATVEEGDAKLTLMMGDARKTIQALEPSASFDAVFLDPFSVPKNPELWSRDFFLQLAKLMTDTAILSTYSCASIVRAGLVHAGFSIRDGPALHPRQPCTLASKATLPDDLSAKYKLKHSLEDPDLNASEKTLREQLW